MHLLAQNTVTVDIANQAGVATGSVTSSIGITTLGRVVEIGSGLVLSIGGLAVFMYLILGGFNWLTAGGDKSKVEAARSMITNAIIGITILAAAFALYGIILKFVGVTTINVGGFGTGGGPGGSSTCTVTGREVNDGGAGHYCVDNGTNAFSAAWVQCFPPGQGSSTNLNYNHYDPCGCLTGHAASGVTFTSCSGQF